jgi:hypothetical protein
MGTSRYTSQNWTSRYISGLPRVTRNPAFFPTRPEEFFENPTVGLNPRQPCYIYISQLTSNYICRRQIWNLGKFEVCRQFQIGRPIWNKFIFNIFSCLSFFIVNRTRMGCYFNSSVLF